jgi:nucleoside phosphorylase/CheY-like chemotaxis protein
VSEFRVLIVEDSAEKARQVSSVVRGELGDAEPQVDVVPDVIGAKRALQDTRYSALILDIQIPMRFGDNARIDGGTRLLEEILLSTTMKRPQYIVGITQYETSYLASAKIFRDNLAGLILYSSSDSGWEPELRSFIRGARLANEQELNAPCKYDADMVIVCALNDPELLALTGDTNTWSPLNAAIDCSPIYQATIETRLGSRKIIAACALEMGMAASGALAGKLIERFRPRYIAMCGIAGGVKGEVNIGDIVVANVVWDYSSGKLQDELGKTLFLPEPKVLTLDPFLKSQFTLFMSAPDVTARIKADWQFKRPDHDLIAHLGPIFTGAWVVADQQKVNELTASHRKLKSIEMEAYAIFCAAEYAGEPKPIAMVVKSISDLADVAKDDAWRKYAAYTSASYVIAWARRYL